ncbi:MAG: hypothetical protein A4E55_00442 [Pelotomaculum sp. PtaU1.Bin035]|nr:MAG: hypothetical protein A4E55_00442 [Pelotomaculum sp. PtaU1.Bin035]
MQKTLLVIIYIFIAVVIVMAAITYVLPILVPFIIALVFSILMEPVIRTLQHRAKLPRGISTLVAMVIVFGGIGIIFTAVILQLVAELIQLSVSLPGIASEFRVYYQDLLEKATAFYVNLPPGVTANLEQNITSLAANLQGLISGAVNSILQVVSMVPGTLTILVVSGLATYFFARDRYQIVEFLLRFIPDPWGEKIVQVMHEISTAFVGYLRAQAILISITTVLSIMGFYLIGANYALTIGLLVGFFDLIPVLGPATVYLPLIIWAFATGAASFGIKLIVLYGVVLLVRQVSETKIVSASIGLHPLATLLAMYAGLKTMGFLGLVMGPILLIAIQATIKSGVVKLK